MICWQNLSYGLKKRQLMNNFYDLNLSDLATLLQQWGEPNFRAKQLWQMVYQQLPASFTELTALPKPLRARLAEHYSLQPLQVQARHRSQDASTHKVLFRAADGKFFETVLMLYDRRRTVCFSTQAGCAMGCVFCATGQMGFERHLTVGEIVAQVLFFARELHLQASALTNLVVMGMGEPFHNYDNTLAALYRLQDPLGFNFGARRITISTVGLIPAFQRYIAEKHPFQLAVSLHAATDVLRGELLPINRRYPLADLLEVCREYIKSSGRRLTFEWALIQDKNDTSEQAHQLGKLLQGLVCHVNVIPLNPTRQYGGHTTTPARALAFQQILSQYQVSCTIRVRRGIDINAGCGQLRTNQLSVLTEVVGTVL